MRVIHCTTTLRTAYSRDNTSKASDDATIVTATAAVVMCRPLSRFAIAACNLPQETHWAAHRRYFVGLSSRLAGAHYSKRECDP